MLFSRGEVLFVNLQFVMFLSFMFQSMAPPSTLALFLLKIQPSIFPVANLGHSIAPPLSEAVFLVKFELMIEEFFSLTKIAPPFTAELPLKIQLFTLDPNMAPPLDLTELLVKLQSITVQNQKIAPPSFAELPVKVQFLIRLVYGASIKIAPPR